jgi:hypothetical protein
MLGYIDSKEKRRGILTQLNRQEFPAPAGAYAFTLDWISEPQPAPCAGSHLQSKLKRHCRDRRAFRRGSTMGTARRAFYAD